MFALYGNTSVDFLVAIGIILGLVAFGAFLRSDLVASAISPGKRSRKGLQRTLILLLQSFSSRFYVILGIFLVSCFFLQMPHAISVVMWYAFFLFLGIQAILILSRILDFSAEEHLQSLSRDQRSVIALFPSIGLWVKIVFSVLFFALVLPNLGFAVTPFFVMLGAGSIVIAFILRDTLADIFSTFVIFFERLFSVGDRIAAGEIRGTVEQIGIRCTRIRSFAGEQLAVPNRDLAGVSILNLSDCPSRRVVLTFPVSHTTDLRALKEVPALLEKAVSSCARAEFVHAKVRTCTRDAVLFEVVYTLEGVSYEDHVSVRHEVYLRAFDALKRKEVFLGKAVVVDSDDA